MFLGIVGVYSDALIIHTAVNYKLYIVVLFVGVNCQVPTDLAKVTSCSLFAGVHFQVPTDLAKVTSCSLECLQEYIAKNLLTLLK